MRWGKKRVILVTGVLIVVVSLIAVIFITNANSYNSIVVVAETEKSSYHYGETVNITLRTVMSNVDFSSNKTVGLWVARIPDEVSPEKVVGNQGALANMIVSQNEYAGGYRCHLSVTNFSTSSNFTLTWNGTVEGPPNPFQNGLLPQNTTYMAPGGYYLVYGDQNSGGLAANVGLMYESDEHSIFHLDGIEPRVNWTHDNSSKEVTFGINVTNAFEDGSLNCSLRAAAMFLNGSSNNRYWTFWNESAILSPKQNQSFNFTVENISLSEQSEMVQFTTIIDTDYGRFFIYCLANEYESSVDWESYGA
ncbi:MAG: hypothetical protein SA339_06980 [Methanomassiliicoccus sp.]|nr:hypothetical protein [Methanomassiliicoccus sp.]